MVSLTWAFGHLAPRGGSYDTLRLGTLPLARPGHLSSLGFTPRGLKLMELRAELRHLAHLDLEH